MKKNTYVKFIDLYLHLQNISFICVTYHYYGYV